MERKEKVKVLSVGIIFCVGDDLVGVEEEVVVDCTLELEFRDARIGKNERTKYDY